MPVGLSLVPLLLAFWLWQVISLWLRLRQVKHVTIPNGWAVALNTAVLVIAIGYTVFAAVKD